ncbi:DUF6011 domain-containing protein [Nonomuraea sp. NPDC049129]|uniref:DUF6011 domain-containing protein n=1 Tax=Nonomuraea sp. NPDC049129 TaxID=3155272 RepID=UPI00340910B0
MTLLLDLSEPATRDHVVLCNACKHTLKTPESRALGLGPDCASKLGLTPRRPIRITGVPAGWNCYGQTDLLEEAHPMEIVRPNEPWTVELYNGERLIDATTLAEELGEVLTWAHARWYARRVMLGSEITVRLSQGDRTWDHEEVAAEYDRRFASAINSWHMTTQEQLDAFEQKYGPREDTRPDATVHRIFPPPEGKAP